MALLCTQPPLVNPVSLQELKAMLRLDPSDTSQDDVLNSLCSAATAWCETVLQRRIVKQQWALYMDFFPGYIDLKLAGQKVSSPFVSGSNAVLVGIRYSIVLPFPPVRSLDSFVYLNANGQSTSMITGPFNISSVTNTIGQQVTLTTSAPHGLVSNATVTIAGNSNLLALCLNQASQTVTVVDPTTLTLTYINGTGSGIPATGTVTGYNFVPDLASQPARLMPIFGQMWPVARVVANAVQMTFTCGYAAPIQVTTSATSSVLGTASFLASNVGQPISIPGAGKYGGTLNTVIQSVSSGNATLRDQPSTTIATPTTALLIDQGTPQHFELVKTAIKFLVNAWFVNRMPSFDEDQRIVIQAILAPARDMRF